MLKEVEAFVLVAWGRKRKKKGDSIILINTKAVVQV